MFLLSLLYTRMQKSSNKSSDVKQEEGASEDERVNEIPLPKGALDTEYTLLEKDPLKDFFQLYLYNTRTIKSEEIEISLPELTIEGIIWHSDMPQAIVDGSVVRIGDIVKGVEIVGIEKKGIIVSYNGEKVLIER